MAKIGRMVKDSMIQELSLRLGERPNLLVTSVHRLSPSDSIVLRQKLFSAHARLRILKRTLGKRFLEGLSIPGLPALGEVKNGSLGFIVAGEDVLPVAKHLVAFIKEHAEHLSLEGGLIEGQVFDKKTVVAFAALPPKLMLLAEVVVTLESPMADVAFTVERLVGDVCWLVEQLAQKKAAAPTN